MQFQALLLAVPRAGWLSSAAAHGAGLPRNTVLSAAVRPYFRAFHGFPSWPPPALAARDLSPSRAAADTPAPSTVCRSPVLSTARHDGAAASHLGWPGWPGSCGCFGDVQPRRWASSGTGSGSRSGVKGGGVGDDMVATRIVELMIRAQTDLSSLTVDQVVDAVEECVDAGMSPNTGLSLYQVLSQRSPPALAGKMPSGEGKLPTPASTHAAEARKAGFLTPPPCLDSPRVWLALMRLVSVPQHAPPVSRARAFSQLQALYEEMVDVFGVMPTAPILQLMLRSISGPSRQLTSLTDDLWRRLVVASGGPGNATAESFRAYVEASAKSTPVLDLLHLLQTEVQEKARGSPKCYGALLKFAAYSHAEYEDVQAIFDAAQAAGVPRTPKLLGHYVSALSVCNDSGDNVTIGSLTREWKLFEATVGPKAPQEQLSILRKCRWAVLRKLLKLGCSRTSHLERLCLDVTPRIHRPAARFEIIRLLFNSMSRQEEAIRLLHEAASDGINPPKDLIAAATQALSAGRSADTRRLVDLAQAYPAKFDSVSMWRLIRELSRLEWFDELVAVYMAYRSAPGSVNPTLAMHVVATDAMASKGDVEGVHKVIDDVVGRAGKSSQWYAETVAHSIKALVLSGDSATAIETFVTAQSEGVTITRRGLLWYLVALCREGRPAEALEVFGQNSSALADEKSWPSEVLRSACDSEDVATALRVVDITQQRSNLQLDAADYEELAQMYDRQNKPDEAARWRRRAEAVAI